MKKATKEKALVKTGFEPSDEPFPDAILEAPQDEAPRLVLADRLLVREGPRGELIVAQCALAPLDREDRRWTPE